MYTGLTTNVETVKSKDVPFSQGTAAHAVRTSAPLVKVNSTYMKHKV